MNKHALTDGIARLEAISADFDYDMAPQYVIWVKKYLQEVQGLTSDTPIFNVGRGCEVDLPVEVKERLEAFLSKKIDYAPTTRNICSWYLIELYAMDLGLKLQSTSIYEPLIQTLEAGGDFYEHNGALCIRDAAMLPFMR